SLDNVALHLNRSRNLTGQLFRPESHMPTQVDIAIIGAGLVGLATGLRFMERLPGVSLVVLEKEASIASHQSGRNSGVIHSGIYYKPGSLKAQLCLEGSKQMVRFCRTHGVPHEMCGKVIIA